MVQLIIDGNVMPELTKNRYQCSEMLLSEKLTMISGRTVLEVRGKVQSIQASYSYIDTELLRNVMAAFRSGKPFSVSYLPDDSNQLRTSEFLVESMTDPTFSFSRDGTPFWTGLAFRLREVAPHA